MRQDNGSSRSYESIVTKMANSVNSGDVNSIKLKNMLLEAVAAARATVCIGVESESLRQEL